MKSNVPTGLTIELLGNHDLYINRGLHARRDLRSETIEKEKERERERERER